MGESSSAAHVILCLSALEGTLSEMQAPITKGEAVAAAQAVLFGS
jgi:aspartate aminotransferase-like enzyme